MKPNEIRIRINITCYSFRRLSIPVASRRSRLVTVARQSRSQSTHDTLFGALRSLLARRAFADVTVADIAREAGTSVGGFYARFVSKEALLYLVLEHILDDSQAALDLALDDRTTAKATVPVIISRYVTTMVRKFREHRIEFTQAARALQGDAGRAGAERTRRFNDHVHGRFRALVLARRREIKHPNPVLAVNLALFFASAAARDAVLSGNLGAYPIRPDDDELIAEITRAACRYLGIRDRP